MSYLNKTLTLIAIATFIRCVIAVSIGLGNDEVYYWLYATHLQWNYFDHPPFVGWLIRLTTFNLYAEADFFIRAGAILSSVIATGLLYLCGKKLKDEHTGFLAAFIYTATIYGSIIAGTFILPDSPQMIFWTAALYLLIHITASQTIDRQKINLLLWFGVSCVNALSTRLHVTVNREGKTFEQEYKIGVPQYEVREIGVSDKTGTRVHFWPDLTIFTASVYNKDILEGRLRSSSVQA